MKCGNSQLRITIEIWLSQLGKTRRFEKLMNGIQDIHVGYVKILKYSIESKKFWEQTLIQTIDKIKETSDST